MNFKAFAIATIASVINVAFPLMVVSKPETSIERINLEVSAPQSSWENNNQVEEKNQNNRIGVNSEEFGSENSERSETLELDRSEDNCHTTQTNQSAVRKTFERYCDWDWKF